MKIRLRRRRTMLFVLLSRVSCFLAKVFSASSAFFAAHLYKRGLKPRDYILDSEIRADTRKEKTLSSLRLCGEFSSVASAGRAVFLSRFIGQSPPNGRSHTL